MSKPVLEVYNISKRFFINRLAEEEGAKAGSAAGSLMRNEFYALKDVSFTLQSGDVLGIIGSNGSGKSTLLKILSGITRPSTGRVEINARLISILDVGAGFHPDFTGRENVLMNSVFMGINRKDMLAAMDDIIAFSGIGEFIDTPVKHYSSGMYLRLATSMVFQLNAGVLVFDEILSVGDAEFRQKVFSKMEELVAKGTTIVMVTHSMNEVMQLCNKCMVLQHGQIKTYGNAAQTITAYLEQSLISEETGFHNQATITGTEYNWNDNENLPGNNTVKVKRVAVKAHNKPLGEEITTPDEIEVEVEFYKNTNASALVVFLVFFDYQRTPIFVANTLWSVGQDKCYQQYTNQTGFFKSVCRIPANLLKSGSYSFDVTFLTTIPTTQPVYRHPGLFHFSLTEPTGEDLNFAPVAVQPRCYWSYEKVV